MKINIIAVGNKMPKWVQEAYQDYAKRLTGDVRVTLTEIPAKKRTKNNNSPQLMAQEGRLILNAIEKNSYVIALAVNGKTISTESLALELKNWQLMGKTITLLIGGADGLAPECCANAAQAWSLSALTLPHPLVRVVLIEQLYRAIMLNKGHPYHRA